MRKNTGKKIVSYFLTMAMVVGGLSLSPIGTVGAQAATAGTKNVNLRLDDNSIAGISNPTSGTGNALSWEGTTVYYGDKAYYVLDKDGSALNKDNTVQAHSSKEHHMLLLSKDALEVNGRAFNRTRSSDWSASTIRGNLNGADFFDNLSTTEQKAISTTEIKDSNTSDYYDYNGGNRPYSNYPSGSNDKIFLLDLDDVQNTNYGFNNNDGTRKADPNLLYWWWLRSPGRNNYYAAYVLDSGYVHSGGGNQVDNVYGSARHAFNLNLSSVLFSSASGYNKSAFAGVEADEVNANTWKLTLKDESGTFLYNRIDSNALTPEAEISRSLPVDRTGGLFFFLLKSKTCKI